MATVFGIYEDIENVQDQPKKDLKVFNAGKNNGNDKEKRPTFAILNNVAYDGRNGAHAQKMAFNVLAAGKKQQTNKIKDENDLPENVPMGVASKLLKAKAAEKYKPFAVYKEEQRITDENAYPTNENNCSGTSSANVSNVSLRNPLQEIPQDELLETPICVRELLSPMSIDKSMIEETATTANDKKSTEVVAIPRSETERFFDVEEYRDDILEYLKESEIRHRPKAMYMRKQPDINHSMRTILVDWLVEVCEEYRLQSETLCLAVSYIDRFLSVMSVVRAKLQLVGTAAMFIAAKYEEIYPPDVGEFVYITDSTYTKTQVLRMEQLILKVLTFDLCVPTTSVFLSAYQIAGDLSPEIRYFAQYFCELSLLEAEPYLQYVPSQISAASIALARYNCRQPIWTNKLEKLTGYSMASLKEIILHLGRTHVQSVSLPQQAIQEKFKATKYSEVSSRMPVAIDETEFTRAIQQSQKDENDVIETNERNENVRKMISSLIFV